MQFALGSYLEPDWDDYTNFVVSGESDPEIFGDGLLAFPLGEVLLLDEEMN